MKDLIPIKVDSRSGYKAEEYPIYIYLNEVRYEINKILDRWYQADQNQEWPVANYFKISTVIGKVFVIKHELESNQWFIVSQDEPLIRFSSN